MRILQVIDSFDVGGAEKMAINYANALAEKIEFSGIVATRKEGELKSQISPKVSSYFLNRKKIIDLKAVFRLRKICKENAIEILQPHSSSYFISLLVKFIYPKIIIVWHDHNGLSEFLNSRKSLVLKIASYFFKGIIVVNYQLKNWAEKELNCKKVIYLPNFTKIEDIYSNETILDGTQGKRILCLANLREQKNHFLLLNVAQKLKKSHPEWTFHLVGKDFNDDYSKEIKSIIIDKKLENNVFIYGTKNDTTSIIKQSDIAILTSKSEGLPVALLEYGLLSKPVICTDVGEIPLLITNEVNGLLVKSGNDDMFYRSLLKLIEDKEFRMIIGNNLYKYIINNNSEEAIISNYLAWIK